MSLLEPGTIFGRDFRIVRGLREGGMGAVYIADQLSTGKQRALKVMAAELAIDPATRERFVLEARAAANIESDHVVEIVTAGVDEESGAPFLVMELLKGEELADALVRLGPLPLGDAAEVLAQVGHALEQAHVQGIVHRDLKPENIFLAISRRRDVAFTAKVLDFGIAKLVEEGRQKTGTQPLGSPLFMSPEQTDRKGRISPATDVWAIGLIAFKMLSGRDFWLESDSLPVLLREICVDPIPFATARAAELRARPPQEGEREVAELPPGFDAWFARCVTRDVDARFPEAGEAVRAFGELVAVDAPRGALVATPGSDMSGSRALPTGAARTARPGTGPGTGPSPYAATAAVTGASMVQTAPQVAPVPPAKSRMGLFVAAGVVAIGAVAAFKVLGGGERPASVPPVTSAAPAATGSATAAAAAPGMCPEGMVLVSGGGFFMGARDLMKDSQPPHEVSVSAFCLDKTEVTTRAYLACVETGSCERPPEKVSWSGITPEHVKLYSPLCNASAKDRGDHPINCVAWPMAENFCKKRGARLPSEAEWELAARGPTQRKYPWGNDPPGPKYLNACGKECVKFFEAQQQKHAAMFEEEDGFAGTAPVGSFPAGASAAGALDLAGNVWEWTADWYGPYTADAAKDPHGPATGTQRVVRGGDFTGSQADWARPAYRWKTDPDTFNHAIGFRCASNPR